MLHVNGSKFFDVVSECQKNMCDVIWRKQAQQPTCIVGGIFFQKTKTMILLCWSVVEHMSGGRNLLPKFLPISFLGVYLVFEVFRDTWHSNKKNPSVYWNAACLVP